MNITPNVVVLLMWVWIWFAFYLLGKHKRILAEHEEKIAEIVSVIRLHTDALERLAKSGKPRGQA